VQCRDPQGWPAANFPKPPPCADQLSRPPRFRRYFLRDWLLSECTCGAQMIDVCRQSELLQQAQALDRWADCRERAVATLELKVRRLIDQKQADEATRLRFAAHYLHQAALRERLHAAALRRMVHQ
jgi:hypothetical protein